MTPDQINQFFSFLYQGRIGEFVFWLRLFAGVITSAAIAGIAVIAIKFRQLNVGTLTKWSPRPPSLREDITSQPWPEVVRKIESANPSDWNLAVIQADAVFDEVLRGMGLPGETMGERLQRLDSSKLQNLNNVWEAHKIRNQIVHESDRILTQEEANRAVTYFKWALQELQYLQE